MKKLPITVMLALLLITYRAAIAQTSHPQLHKQINISRTHNEIIIDGELEEKDWSANPPAKDFWQQFPSDSVQAIAQTEVSMTYNDEFLYVAVKCYSIGNQYITQSLKRDYNAGGSDNITLVFDTFDDRTNSFVFGLNPFGVRREALISNGGQNPNDFSTNWDNKWHGKSSIKDGYWVAEFAIPFKTLRFKEGATKWRFNCYRFDTQSNERSSWIRVPRNQMIMNLAFMGDMNWDRPLGKSGVNVALIPYAIGQISQDFEAGEMEAQKKSNFGGDAKIAMTSGLNLDLTINPDFSQVEVDQQVTNLDRFEIFFPERRQFFVENADLFSGFGTKRTTPFFSRRIGITTDTATNDNISNRIIYGAKISGKLNQNWRLGLLNMQTAADESNALPSFNYSVIAMQRKLFTRSNLGFIIVNKQAFEDIDSNSLYDAYNRVVGVDYNLASDENDWRGNIFYHQAITTADSIDIGDKFSHGASLTYQNHQFQLDWQHMMVGKGYDAQVGFVRRNNFFRLNPEAQFFLYSNTNLINQHQVGTHLDYYWSLENQQLTDYKIEVYWKTHFQNTARFQVTIQKDYIYLFNDFDPTGTNSEELPAYSEYDTYLFKAKYNSNRRNKFNYSLGAFAGEFYNGNRYGFEGSFNYRFQPFGMAALKYEVNRIILPDPYATTYLALLGAQLDITFTKNVFWTTFIQYNNQQDNFNINTRFQWRYSAVSDFFLVYTDDYYTTDFAPKNRAIVAKWTYWLGI